MRQNNQTVYLGQPQAVIVYGSKQVNVPINCVFFSGKVTRFDTGLDSCLMIIPRINGNSVDALGSSLYLSRRVKNTLFAKLYLFGQDSESFKIAYTDEGSIPLAMYNGVLIGPLKIWEIKYPKEGLNIPEYYYTNELPDPRVMASR